MKRAGLTELAATSMLLLCCAFSMAMIQSSRSSSSVAENLDDHCGGIGEKGTAHTMARDRVPGTAGCTAAADAPINLVALDRGDNLERVRYSCGT